MNKKTIVVITTINDKPKNTKFFAKKKWEVLLIGDQKSKQIQSTKLCQYYSLPRQFDLSFNLVKSLPQNHYSRKNIGYLIAIKSGAEIIYDTDDDNLPLEDLNCPEFKAKEICYADSNMINIYKHFTKEKIWPRGYLINKINEDTPLQYKKNPSKIGVWQGITDGDTDVDAIYRLVINKHIKFDNSDPVAIKTEVYSPFNSQNTFWRKELFPLLYLPSTVSFRFTDILRGFVAQRIMWQHGYNLGFLRTNVFQNRNKHDLTKDFALEISTYINTEKVIQILQSVKLGQEITSNLYEIYKKLSEENIVGKEELNILKAWINDLKSIQFNSN